MRSDVVVFRAIVMLLFLVGLPAAWIVLDPLPAPARQAISRAARTLGNSTGLLPERLAPESPVDQKSAPVFQPSEEPDTGGVVPASFSIGAANPAGGAAASDQATRLEAELEPQLEILRQMGVSQYALREWGGSGSLYRFSCSVTMGAISREFDAIAARPADAVREVVGDVSAWQNARSSHVILR